MRETSSRMIFVGVCAWMSACLLISGWMPEMGESLRVVWMLSGLTGLVASVGLAEVVKADIRRQDQTLQAYMTAALTDGLTGLGNRQAFDQVLTSALQEQENSRDRICLLMIDVDHFKSVNDNYGHQAGDKVLKLMSGLATRFFSNRGAVARYGGEEFAVALSGFRLREAVKVANEFRELVQQLRCEYHESRINLTVSIGVAEANRGERHEDLIRRADNALYSAKKMGRNCVWFADPMTESAAELILDAITQSI